ncbi:hypothetical protein AB0M36_34005 [Actinoplanes sp. NPDC051346]|uniref:hypothetical protein n=1 Tax=Actinoplanes sp. NPDC051346 TaxID=3155048 RepID=UPI00342FA22D
MQQLIKSGIHRREDRSRPIIAGESIKEHLLALQIPVAVVQQFEMSLVEHARPRTGLGGAANAAERLRTVRRPARTEGPNPKWWVST